MAADDGGIAAAHAHHPPAYHAVFPGAILRSIDNASKNFGAASVASAYYEDDDGGGGPLPLSCGTVAGSAGPSAASHGKAVLRYAKLAVRRTASAYLSSPLLLALVPLLLGLCVGYALGRWGRRPPPPPPRDGGGGGSADGSEPSRGRRKRKEEEGGCRSAPSDSACAFVSGCGYLRGWSLLVTSAAVVATCAGMLRHALLAGATTGDDGPPVRSSSGRRTSRSWAAGGEGDEGGGREEEEEEEEEDEQERERREGTVRRELLSDANSGRESGVDLAEVPRHVAVIMDGNRRYGRRRYGSAARGHWDGSRTLADFAKWCMAEGVQILTVYAFSTENWNRDPDEVAALMAIFCRYCDELRGEAVRRGIRIEVLSTVTDKIPDDVKAGLKRMVDETAHCDGFLMNICLSYGSRGEIVNACRSISCDVRDGRLGGDDVTEETIGRRLLTRDCPDPDVVIRTSGEMRISNFLLWQAAYSELFFLEKQWPELTKEDLVGVIRSFADGRQRRFGK